jgi:ABC-type multidrug transport system ATPase subunit
MSIFVRHLTKRFTAAGTVKTVLDDLHLEIPPGHVYALTGNNGTGKTTLLKIIATLISPSAGTVSVNGIDTVTDAIQARRRIGFAYNDDRGFYQMLSLKNNLLFSGLLFGLSARICSERIEQLGTLFAIAPWLREKISHCSAGIRQRAALLRALLHDPDVLLIDELTRSLDTESSERISQGIKTWVSNGNKTCLIVTHDKEWIRRHADSAGVLVDGKIRNL